MLWDHTAYCRRCRRRVFVAPRHHSRAGERVMLVATFGLWRFFQWWRPRAFGRWQCDECGSTRCVWARKVAVDAEGRRLRKRRRKPAC